MYVRFGGDTIIRRIGMHMEIVSSADMPELLIKQQEYLCSEELQKKSNCSDWAVYCAKQAASKIAVAKACGIEPEPGLLQEIRIVKDELGRPEIVLDDVTKQKMAVSRNDKIHISVSSERGVAAAIAVYERTGAD
jgi:phosphopantetheinyl transferase (holo-ACP synthase)